METLRNEGVLVESVFLERTPEADFLIYYMRAVDMDRAFRVARESNRPIDAYHRRFKEEAWGPSTNLELLMDLESLEDLEGRQT